MEADFHMLFTTFISKLCTHFTLDIAHRRFCRVQNSTLVARKCVDNNSSDCCVQLPHFILICESFVFCVSLKLIVAVVLDVNILSFASRTNEKLTFFFLFSSISFSFFATFRFLPLKKKNISHWSASIGFIWAYQLFSLFPPCMPFEHLSIFVNALLMRLTSSVSSKLIVTFIKILPS